MPNNGNDNYAPPHALHNCCKDEQDKENMLTSLGFECTLLLNGRKQAMKSTEINFRENLRQGDCVLVYFSGYGMDDKHWRIQGAGANGQIPNAL